MLVAIIILSYLEQSTLNVQNTCITDFPCIPDPWDERYIYLDEWLIFICYGILW